MGPPPIYRSTPDMFNTVTAGRGRGYIRCGGGGPVKVPGNYTILYRVAVVYMVPGGGSSSTIGKHGKLSLGPAYTWSLITISLSTVSLFEVYLSR